MSGQQHAPAALYPGKDPVPILQEAGGAPGQVWTGGKSRPHRDPNPDRLARSSVAIPTELPGPQVSENAKHIDKCACVHEPKERYARGFAK